METFTFPHIPTQPHHSGTAHFALFRNVTNAAQLRKRIVEAARMEGERGESEREAVGFGFVDARLVRWFSCFFFVPFLGAAVRTQSGRWVAPLAFCCWSVWCRGSCPEHSRGQ